MDLAPVPLDGPLSGGVVADGDTIIVSGGGIHRTVTVRKNGVVKLGRAGNVPLASFIGHRLGDVVMLEEKSKALIATALNPDLDRSAVDAVEATEEGKDNRALFDTHGANQTLSAEEIREQKAGGGMDALIKTLVDNSTSYENKTAFSQEKYIRKKKAKYVSMFKIERPAPDTLAEVHAPTALIDADTTDDTTAGGSSGRYFRMRVDALALMTHYANIGPTSHVLCHDRTNGVLPATLLYRMHSGMTTTTAETTTSSTAAVSSSEVASADAAAAATTTAVPLCRLYCAYDKTSMPNTVFCRNMNIPLFKERWRAVPKSEQLLLPTPPTAPTTTTEGGDDNAAAVAASSSTTEEKENNNTNNNNTFSSNTNTSQWLRAKDARDAMIHARPVDSLVIAGYEDEISAMVLELWQFLALSGSLVVYSPFLEPLTELYSEIRNDAVCINISETWYRHQQVLPGRTHPQVNMSTAGGYLLTAVKVAPNTLSTLASRTAAHLEKLVAREAAAALVAAEAKQKNGGGKKSNNTNNSAAGQKRSREDDEVQQDEQE